MFIVDKRKANKVHLTSAQTFNIFGDRSLECSYIEINKEYIEIT